MAVRQDGRIHLAPGGVSSETPGGSNRFERPSLNSAWQANPVGAPALRGIGGLRLLAMAAWQAPALPPMPQLRERIAAELAGPRS